MSNPYCQMCRKELCVVCKQKLDSCKCPCPNFVICRYCEVHEKTLPPCDDMFPAIGSSSGGVGFGSGGFGGGGSMGKMMMPFMMMMMMNANKNGGGKSCQCRRGRDRKRDREDSPRRDREWSPRRDRDPPVSGHPCCCKPAPILQPIPVLNRPPPPVSCTCSSRGDAHNDKCREPINQYFFGSDCSPQLPLQQAPQGSYLPPIPPQAYDENWSRPSANPPQANPQNESPKSSQSRNNSNAGKPKYAHHKPVSRRNNSIVLNKVS